MSHLGEQEAYLDCHGVPFSVPTLVLDHVVDLCEYEQCDGYDVDGDQGLVAVLVLWPVGGAVYICGYDASKLDRDFN
jgi:hypothetical protein